MGLLSQLFSDWVGWLSFIVIAFIVGMGVFFFVWFDRKADESAREAAKEADRSGA